MTTPSTKFPQSLARLGFVGKTSGYGKPTEYILPPVCDVPAGPFLMGSDPTRDPQAYYWEEHQYVVTLPAYQIARYPVTAAEYGYFVRAGHREPLRWDMLLKTLDYPVGWVSWHDAMAYAAWLAKWTGQFWRLPTEAEWEKAARGVDGRIFPWGDSFDQTRCNTLESHIDTTPVYAYPSGASPYGVQDMAGNRYEWTSSLHNFHYPYTVADGREDLNVAGDRVIRGGWRDGTARDARAAFRHGRAADHADYSDGFRLALGEPNS